MECSVCLDTFSNAVVLQCGHSFCELCVKELKKCPECRQPFNGFVPNYSIRRSVEAARSAEAPVDAVATPARPFKLNVHAKEFVPGDAASGGASPGAGLSQRAEGGGRTPKQARSARLRPLSGLNLLDHLALLAGRRLEQYERRNVEDMLCSFAELCTWVPLLLMTLAFLQAHGSRGLLFVLAQLLVALVLATTLRYCLPRALSSAACHLTAELYTNTALALSVRPAQGQAMLTEHAGYIAAAQLVEVSSLRPSLLAPTPMIVRLWLSAQICDSWSAASAWLSHSQAAALCLVGLLVSLAAVEVLFKLVAVRTGRLVDTPAVHTLAVVHSGAIEAVLLLVCAFPAVVFSVSASSTATVAASSWPLLSQLARFMVALLSFWLHGQARNLLVHTASALVEQDLPTLLCFAAHTALLQLLLFQAPLAQALGVACLALTLPMLSTLAYLNAVSVAGVPLRQQPQQLLDHQHQQ